MPRASRNSYKTMSLEGLELDSNLSGEWTWQTPISTYKYQTYVLKRSETDKTHTTCYLRVNYKRKGLEWREESRYKWYRRQTKYLAINGPFEGQYIIASTPDYKLYYTQRGTGGSLPRKILVHADSMARKLGLLW